MTGSQYAVEVFTADGSKIVENAQLLYLNAANQPVPNVNAITSGALPQLAAWVSGTAQQNPASEPVTVVLAPTSDGTNNAATVAIALSPDNTTYTTVATWSIGAGVNAVGAVADAVSVTLPTGWYIKLTIGAHASVPQSYYY